MRRTLKYLASVALLGLATACTSGNSGLQPPFKSAAPYSQDALQLAVGVATFFDGSKGLNTVTTWRQPNGLSATLLSIPAITLPAGDTVPGGVSGTTTYGLPFGGGCANVDGATGAITGSPQALPGTKALCTTFGQNGGAFAYGFEPDNAQTTGSYLCGFLWQPVYFDTVGAPFDGFVGGPPAFPDFSNGTVNCPSPPFYGFSEGFTTFDMPAVAGTYSLSLNIPASNVPAATIGPVAAGLNSTAGLPKWTTLSFHEDGAGGGTAHYTAPAGVTEVIVNLIDVSQSACCNGGTQGYVYTQVGGGGTQSLSFPDNLGPVPNPNAPATASINAGDEYEVQFIGVDYPAFEAAPPNTSQTPAIVGANGQADVTLGIAGWYQLGPTAPTSCFYGTTITCGSTFAADGGLKVRGGVLHGAAAQRVIQRLHR